MHVVSPLSLKEKVHIYNIHTVFSYLGKYITLKSYCKIEKFILHTSTASLFNELHNTLKDVNMHGAWVHNKNKVSNFTTNIICHNKYYTHYYKVVIVTIIIHLFMNFCDL